MEKLNLMPSPEPAEVLIENKNTEIERVLLGKTKDGASVYDRADSHFHPEGGLTPELLGAALSTIDTQDRDFLKEQVNFDYEIGKQTCVDVGPDDEIVMVYRKGRSGQTPMVKNREMKPCSSLIVILKQDRNASENSYELVTSFIGESSEREPWDPNISSDEELARAENFWRTHALLYDDRLIDWEKTKAYEFMSEPAKKVERVRQRTVFSGLFIDPEDLYHKIPPTLAKTVKYPHVTTNFKPSAEQLNLAQVGETAKIYAVGYGNDGKNEGLLVKIEAEDPGLQELCDAIEVPHITLSISKGAQAKNTANLSFEPLNTPFELTGKYGLFAQNRVLDTQEKLPE